MTSRDLGHLQDIHQACMDILKFTQDHTHEHFIADDMVQGAVIYKILIIGEATNRLSTELKSLYTQIPWGQIIGARNRLIHQYHDFDIDVVWNMVSRSIPELLNQITTIIEQEKQ